MRRSSPGCRSCQPVSGIVSGSEVEVDAGMNVGVGEGIGVDVGGMTVGELGLQPATLSARRTTKRKAGERSL